MDKRASSKKGKTKPTTGKGKKADEAERALTGAGWTTAATTKYLELETDEERFEFLYGMFSITDEQYKYDMKSTVLIDFHMHNALYCQENNFDVLQTQFVCRTFDRILHHAIEEGANIDESVTQSPEVDKLRAELFEMFKAAFNELNAGGEYHFTPEQTQNLVQFFSVVIIRPIRLILYQFNIERRSEMVPEFKKIFIPISPIPLSECEEELPVVEESMQFQPMVIPRNGITLEDAREMIEKYTEGVIDTINKRYDALEELVTKIQPIVSER